ncbi:MAG: DUF6502 family protein [Gammaproteobacteria bacterium]|nr:DUF6502 family protein [Gammaproteobacteria bacterium]
MASKTVQTSITKLLRPLVRMLIRTGIPHGEFAEIAKRVYVEIASDDFQIRGRKQTSARISMLTGIQRKEVSRLQKLPVTEPGQLDLEYNRAVRVTGGWRKDRLFLDESGIPRHLPFEGDAGFTGLVRRYSGDLPARAVLDELLRVGTVELDASGLIHLTTPTAHVPHHDQESQYNIMGNTVKDLLSTIDHNFESSSRETRLQLTVAYDNLPEHAVKRFQHISHEDSVALLNKFDKWLSEQDRDANPEVDQNLKDGRFRAGIGIYYFAEPYSDASADTDQSNQVSGQE